MRGVDTMKQVTRAKVPVDAPGSARVSDVRGRKNSNDGRSRQRALSDVITVVRQPLSCMRVFEALSLPSGLSYSKL